MMAWNPLASVVQRIKLACVGANGARTCYFSQVVLQWRECRGQPTVAVAAAASRHERRKVRRRATAALRKGKARPCTAREGFATDGAVRH